jgi:predicted PurR-regulated permease PerM
MSRHNFRFSIPRIPIQQLISATLVAGLVALLFWLLFRFHHQFLILFAGITISLALRPIVVRLKQRGISPGVTILLLYALFLIVAIIFLRFIMPILSEQIVTVVARVTDGFAALLESLRQTSSILIHRLLDALQAATFPGAVAPAAPADPELSLSPLEQGQRMLGQGLRSGFEIAAMLLIAFSWTIESERIKASALSLLPFNQRDSARALVNDIEQRVSGYVSGQLTLSLIIGSLSFVAYLIIGLPNALVLALFVGLMEIVPLIGPLIGAVPAVIVGLSASPLTGLWVVVISLVIHQLESAVLSPRVMKKSINMNPLVTLLALTAFGSLFGILGAVIALPFVSIIQLLFNRYVVETPQANDADGGRDQIGLLRYETQSLIEDLRKSIRHGSSSPFSASPAESVEDALEAIAIDLDSLLASAKEAGTP